MTYDDVKGGKNRLAESRFSIWVKNQPIDRSYCFNRTLKLKWITLYSTLPPEVDCLCG